MNVYDQKTIVTDTTASFVSCILTDIYDRNTGLCEMSLVKRFYRAHASESVRVA
jgi:hypothetical protein